MDTLFASLACVRGIHLLQKYKKNHFICLWLMGEYAYKMEWNYGAVYLYQKATDVK